MSGSGIGCSEASSTTDSVEDLESARDSDFAEDSAGNSSCCSRTGSTVVESESDNKLSKTS
ncbi:hypothetical protein RirG_259220 [Rhizophagus irregularis DAOM 197198w]|uniref:Uncharacterized protein n=1 Tax=Rhizophagus irregularis (strain DAOM 197198w) TaxID=1432141 RepID=A0A015LA99_RHIIW|nr:hypothetical protein RirG_259220 [Rhizophagus irregularis DAOM 197198w]